jgi:hypothetical protein
MESVPTFRGRALSGKPLETAEDVEAWIHVWLSHRGNIRAALFYNELRPRQGTPIRVIRCAILVLSRAEQRCEHAM